MAKQWFFLALILTLAGGLRFYRLGEVPHGLHMDEVSMVYNGWSIAWWNRDEQANLLPLSFASFGDYKPPFMIYLLAFIFKVFGLQITAIRIISALAGIASVGLIFLIGKVIYKKITIPLVAALVLALSSWSVTLSRVGYEQYLALFFVCIGILGLLKIKQLGWWLVSGLGLTLSMYTFHTAKIFVPVFITWYVWHKRNEISQFSRQLFHLILLLGGLSLPWLIDNLFGPGAARAETLIFFDPDWPQLLIHNVIAYASPLFWIGGIDGVSIRHAVPGYGVMYLIEFIFFGIGLVTTSKSWLRGWLVIGLLPGLLTVGSPHALRTLFAIIPAILLTAEGFFWCINRLGRLRLGLAVTAALALVINSGLFLNTYFTDYAVASAPSFAFGMEQAIASIDEYRQGIEKIHITDGYGQPYVYVLLYRRIDPQAYLWGALNDYQFGPINWDVTAPNRLYIGLPSEIPSEDSKVVKTIYIPGTNRPALVMAKT